MPIYLKFIITAAIIVLVSEIAQRAERLGALITALPLVSVIAMIWMFVDPKEGNSSVTIGNHAFYTFWYVLPTLPMFLVMSQMLKKGSSFWMALGAYIVGTLALFLLMNLIIKRFGISLM